MFGLTPSRRGYARAAAALAAIVILASCAQAQPARTTGGGQVNVAPPSQPTFTVTRGSITDTIQSSGRVVATQQQTLYFRQSGHLIDLAAHLDDKVKAGQVLASLDTTTLKQQIAQQQAAVDAASLDLEKLKEQLATSGTTTSQVITPQDVAAADAAVTSAQAAYDAAQANAAALATPDSQVVKQAQAGVTQAQAALTKAQLQLQALTAGPTAAQKQQAQAAVNTAQAKLDAAKQQLGVVQAGPTANQLAQARSALAQAQTQYQAALATYQAFQNGPTDAQRQQATLAVTQAQNALYAAQTKRDSVCNNAAKATAPASDCNAANATVNSAQSSLDAAQTNLAQLGIVTANDRLAAEAAYSQAQDQLTTAQQTYQEVVQGAVPTSGSGSAASGSSTSRAAQLAQAQAAVEQAQANLLAAQAAENGLVATPNSIAQAKQAVIIAQAGVQNTQAQLTSLQTPPASAEQQAQDTVKEAAASVIAAQAKAQRLRDLVGQTDTNTLALAVQQQVVAQAQLGLEALQDQLSQMQIVAPFDGTIIASNGQAGAQIAAFAPVLTIANPQTLDVAVDLSPAQVSRVAMGQQVKLTIRSFPGQNITGTVTGLPSIVLAASNLDQSSPGAAASGQTAAASSSSTPAIDPSAVVIAAKWPGSGPSIGDTALVTISAQTKDNVLLVPTQTINTLNNRTFVLVDQNGHELPVDVQVGIQNTDMTEVQSGLTAGQKVFGRTA